MGSCPVTCRLRRISEELAVLPEGAGKLPADPQEPSSLLWGAARSGALAKLKRSAAFRGEAPGGGGLGEGLGTLWSFQASSAYC